jgi:hypothetical protein
LTGINNQCGRSGFLGGQQERSPISTLIMLGAATSKIWSATPWKELPGMVRDRPPAEFLMESR